MVQDHFWKKHKKDYSSLLYQKGLKIHLFLSHNGPFSRHFGILLPVD